MVRPRVSSTPMSSRVFTSRERWSKGPVYRKYKFAINRVWNVDDLDFTQDAEDWKRIDEQQRDGLLGVTIRFLAGEQAVTDELVPMIAASHALGRFDWVTYLSTFLMEEAKHAEFFMRWHDEVVGVLEPEEVARHFLVREATADPSGRFTGPRCAARGPPRLWARAARGLDGGRRGANRARLRAFLGGLQRLRRGSADDALIRDRDRHHRSLERLPWAEAGLRARSSATRGATSHSVRGPAGP